MPGEVGKRWIAGLTLGLAALGLCLFDLWRGSTWGVVIIGAFIALTAAAEYRLLVRPQADRLPLWLFLGGCVLLTLMGDPRLRAPVEAATGLPVTGLLLGALLVALTIRHMVRWAGDGFTANLGAAAFGLLWIAIPCHLLVELGCRATPGRPTHGVQLVLLAIIACKLGDVFAFFGGRAFGRHKMCPRISPGKTWEGFACSLAGSLIGVWAFGALTGATWFVHSGPPFDAWWKLAVFALVVGPAGALGDLVESCVKRSLAAKDSGAVVPGFGGILDVYDAILIALPVAALVGPLLQ